MRPAALRARARQKKGATARAGAQRRKQLKYRTDPEYRAQVRAKLQASKTPEKNHARRYLGRAISNGKIQRQPCACGNPRSHGHHEDYSKPLDVIWLCASCHSKLHYQKSLLNLDNY